MCSVIISVIIWEFFFFVSSNLSVFFTVASEFCAYYKIFKIPSCFLICILFFFFLNINDLHLGTAFYIVCDCVLTLFSPKCVVAFLNTVYCIISFISTGLKCHSYYELNIFVYLDMILDSCVIDFFVFAYNQHIM